MLAWVSIKEEIEGLKRPILEVEIRIRKTKFSILQVAFFITTVFDEFSEIVESDLARIKFLKDEKVKSEKN